MSIEQNAISNQDATFTSRRESAQGVSDTDGLSRVSREFSEKRKRIGLSGLPRQSPLRLETTRIDQEPQIINANNISDNAIVTVPQQNEVSDTLQDQLNSSPSSILNTNLNPISPPLPPKIFRDIYKVAVGGYLLGKVGGEVVASGRETMRIREQARDIGTADAISKVNKEAREIWKNISLNEKVLVFDYLRERGIDPERSKAVELVMTFKELDKARKKKIENATEKDSIIIKKEKTEILKHKIDADIERLGERAKAIAEFVGVLSYTLSSSFFRGIAGVSKGVAQGLGSNRVVGSFAGSTMLLGGGAFGISKLTYVSELLSKGGSIPIPDVLSIAGLSWITVTGAQTLVETFRSKNSSRIRKRIRNSQ